MAIITIYNQEGNIVRSDRLPPMVLHQNECWERSNHTCPDFPEEDLTEISGEGFFIDYNHYDLTIHCSLQLLVIEDYTMVGCYMNWEEANRIPLPGSHSLIPYWT